MQTGKRPFLSAMRSSSRRAPHQICNDSDSDLELLIVADNPVGESYYYPDDAMWMVNSPEPHYVVLHAEREDP